MWLGLSDGHTSGVMRWTDTSLFREVTTAYVPLANGAALTASLSHSTTYVPFRVLCLFVYILLVYVCLFRQDLNRDFVDLEKHCVAYDTGLRVSERRDCDDYAAYICQTLDDDVDDDGNSDPNSARTSVLRLASIVSVHFTSNECAFTPEVTILHRVVAHYSSRYALLLSRATCQP